MKNNETEFFATRHSLKVGEGDKESKKYPGLVYPEGEELGKERARHDIAIMIEQAPAEAVILIGGASNQIRTKSTAQLYGDNLKELFKDRNDVAVITRDEMTEIMSSGNKKESYRNIFENNFGKKIVIDFPMYLKELPLAQWILDLPERENPEAIKEWLIKGTGMVNEKGESAPDPEEVAKNQIKALEKLKIFVEQYAKGRPLVIGAVGHSWNLDALLAYLASNKKGIDAKAYEKICQGEIGIRETQLIKFKIKDDKVELNFRGKNFEL